MLLVACPATNSKSSARPEHCVINTYTPRCAASLVACGQKAIAPWNGFNFDVRNCRSGFWMRPFVRFGNLLKFSRPQNVIKFNASSLFLLLALWIWPRSFVCVLCGHCCVCGDVVCVMCVCRCCLLAANADDGFLSLDAPVFMPRHKSGLKASHITPPFGHKQCCAVKNIDLIRCKL